MISPTASPRAAALGPVTVAELEAWLAGRASRGRLRLKRWWVPWLALAVVVVIAVVVLVAAFAARATRPRRARSGSSNELACPVCTGESVADSNAPESRAIRARHREAHRGRPDRRARSATRTSRRYGEHVLLTPSNGGLGLIAWGVPVLALVLGAGGIALAVRRWSRTPRLAATADDDDVVDRERHRTPRSTRTTSVTDFDRDALEAERDFLLRSLDDLEAERAAGNIDDDTYRRCTTTTRRAPRP